MYNSICGINPKNLSSELLHQVEFYVLIDLLYKDYRVEHVVCDKLESKYQLKQLSYKKYVIRMEDFPHLKKVYNKKLRELVLSEHDNNRYCYNDTVIIQWLDEANIQIEIKNLLDGKESIIDKSNIDYDKAYGLFPVETSEMINKIIATSGHGMSRLIETAPESKINEIFEMIAKDSQNKSIANMLSNPKCPEKLIPTALRAIGKLSVYKVPSIKITITIEHLKSLPTITRLNTLERILQAQQDYKFTMQTIKSADEISNVLFSSSIRYPDRVSSVVKQFESILNK